jgi:hypothetical protein
MRCEGRGEERRAQEHLAVDSSLIIFSLLLRYPHICIECIADRLHRTKGHRKEREPKLASVE